MLLEGEVGGAGGAIEGVGEVGRGVAAAVEEYDCVGVGVFWGGDSAVELFGWHCEWFGGLEMFVKWLLWRFNVVSEV